MAGDITTQPKHGWRAVPMSSLCILLGVNRWQYCPIKKASLTCLAHLGDGTQIEKWSYLWYAAQGGQDKESGHFMVQKPLAVLPSNFANVHKP
jgi:hypothetical protein